MFLQWLRQYCVVSVVTSVVLLTGIHHNLHHVWSWLHLCRYLVSGRYYLVVPHTSELGFVTLRQGSDILSTSVPRSTFFGICLLDIRSQLAPFV